MIVLTTLVKLRAQNYMQAVLEISFDYSTNLLLFCKTNWKILKKLIYMTMFPKVIKIVKGNSATNMGKP